ncbi:MAG: hypothetical protein VCA36_11305 [Opitutales bacterium]
MTSTRRLWCRLSAVLVLALGLGVWLWHGARLGFWVTSVEKYVPDPEMVKLGIDDMLIPIREDRFLTGIETLVLTLALALLLWGLSFLFSGPDEKSKNPS